MQKYLCLGGICSCSKYNWPREFMLITTSSSDTKSTLNGFAMMWHFRSPFPLANTRLPISPGQEVSLENKAGREKQIVLSLCGSVQVSVQISKSTFVWHSMTRQWKAVIRSVSFGVRKPGLNITLTCTRCVTLDRLIFSSSWFPHL